MSRARARRGRVSLAVLAGLAIGAFVLGAAVADGRSPNPDSPTPDVAVTLPLKQLAGERIVVGLRGTAVSTRLRAAIQEGRVAGVVLFAANLPTRAAGSRLIRQLQGIRRPPPLRDPLLIMVDQEGGLVKRVSGAPAASAREMGARGGAFSARQGRRAAANLRDLGINVDLAPVLDVGRPGGVIADTERSFGSTARRVRATAVPFARALQSGDVAATAKHFPGFGAARENTDFAVQRIDLSRRELRRVDEAPYPAFIAAGGKLVMLSTAIYPAFSDEPAAFTRSIATGELRERLGFEGVSITDALETVAVREFGGPEKAGLAAARAGADLLLFTELAPAEKAWRALARQLRSGALSRDEFEVAVQRVLDLRSELYEGTAARDSQR
ncbi:MAG TPA: glycoside hydrolase family 3 N-terminal domain-containing protein [Solirubrobacterales bacterium]|jgi:beta-N-acetylhexosaminidase|nr:glycoside hydrolase family 3 N-terminal domain-containing protein [Solirubrobacterales bacterium]